MAKTAAALHILVKEEAQAKALLAQLEKGGNFQQLAKKHSTCPSGRNGGDLGEIVKGETVLETTATATGDIDAKFQRRVLFIGNQVFHLGGCGVGKLQRQCYYFITHVLLR